MNAKSLCLATKETCKKFLRDEPFQKAAAVSYFALLSLTPLFLIAVSIAGILYGQKNAEIQLANDLSEMMGREAAATIQSIIQHGNTLGKGLVSIIFGIFMIFLGASSIFGQLRTSLNQIWEVKIDFSTNRLRRYLGGRGLCDEN